MSKIPQRVLPKGSVVWLLALVFIAGSGFAFSRQQERSHLKAWLGVSIRDVTENIAKENNLSDESGAYVIDVAEHSPADSAGIEERDVIVEFGQKTIEDANALVKAVAKSNVGDKINVVFVRKGEKRNVQVVLAKVPRMRGPRLSVDNFLRRIRIFSDQSSQGMQLMELNDQLGEYFGVPNGTGVLVEKVRKGSAAEKAGIKAGDVLLKIGKRTIDDLEDVSKAFSKYEDGDNVDVEVSRKGANKTFSLEVKEDRDHSTFEFFGPGHEGMFEPTPFEENSLWTPQWNGENHAFEFRDFGPDWEVLERNLQSVEESLKNQQNKILKSARELRVQSI